MSTRYIATIALIAFIFLAVGAWLMFGPDPKIGKRLAENNCGVCHDLTEKLVHERGPYLWGIFNRPAGAMDYAYSEAFLQMLRKSPFSWDEEHLDAFIANPSLFLAGTRMTQRDGKHPIAFEGMQDSANRKNLIAYLKTLK